MRLYQSQVGSCGYHSSLTDDLGNVFTFEDHVCNVCAGAAQYGRVLAAEDEKALKRLGENPPPRMPRPSDGRTTHIRKLSVLEAEEERERRRASRSPSLADPPSLGRRSR